MKYRNLLRKGNLSHREENTLQIISHRGYCLDYKKENNTKVAFKRSFDMGYGTETDLRDLRGEIVVSHDMPTGNEMTFESFLQLLDGDSLLLALNIKADGISDKIYDILSKYNYSNYFMFDMSIPELVYEVKRTDLNVYTGFSDINPNPPMLEEVKGVWLDAFYEIWYSTKQIDDMLARGKNVCVVSEDLHGRSNERQWRFLREYYRDENRVVLCTNFLEDAIRYFDKGE